MRTIEADGSITGNCPKCNGSGIMQQAPLLKCECGTGRIVIAPPGSTVKDESPVVKKYDNYGDGLPSIVTPPAASAEVPDAAIVDSVEPATSAVAIEDTKSEPIQETEPAE